MNLKRILSWCLSVLAGITFSADLEIPERNERPLIDGKADDACWRGLPWRSGFTRCGTGKQAEANTRFKIFTSKGTLYIAVEASEPEMQKIVKEKKEHDSPAVWRNDSIEINLVPDPKAMSFYKFIIDSTGQYADLQLTDDNTDSGRFNAFNEWDGMPEIRTSAGKNFWTVEAAIPLGAMQINEDTPDTWRFNVFRHRFAGGKTESTSYSRLPKPGTLQPASFLNVKLHGFKAVDYPFSAGKSTFTFQRGKDGVFEFKINGVVHNGMPKFRLAKVRFALNNGTKTYQAEKLEPFKGKSSTVSKNVIRDVPQGEYQLNFSIYSNSSVPVLLCNVSRKVKLEYSPLKIRLVNPPYRSNVYATMPDKILRADILLNEDTGIPLTATLSNGKDIRLEQTIRAAEWNNRVNFDMASLPDGCYTLSVSGKGGQGIFKTDTTVQKLPYRKGEVWLDNRGVTHVDGKPVLPFGWYGTQPDKPDKSVNWIILMTRFADIDSAVKTIRKNLESGQRTAIYMTQEITGRAWDKPVLFAESARKGGLSPAQREKIIRFVSAIGKTDGLLAWYMADEPEGRDNNPLFYEEALELIRKHDPYHPGIMLNYGLYGIKRYYRGADILIPDCYAQYWEDGTTEKPRSSTSEWVRTAAALRPAWLCTQMSLWPARHPDGRLRGVPPDYRDQRMQFLQAIIHNAKGFSMYTYYYGQIYSSLIIGHEELGRTLQLIREYVFADTIPNGVTIKGAEPPAFQAGLKKVGKEFCLIAVNTSLKAQKMEFLLKNRFSGNLYEGGGKGVFKVGAGRFTDTLAPKESRLYLTDGKLAQEIPDVAAVERRIAEHRAGRRKKGNLIGTGELYEADYLDFAAGRIPAHTVKIAASSDATFHATKRTGSLYYLVDGLTEPTRFEFTWSPKSSDKTPWLNFVLPEPSPVRLVKLYTPDARITSCRVTAGGKKYEIKENRKNVIEIPIDGTMTSEVKIEFLKTKPATTGKDRLLSEVEIY